MSPSLLAMKQRWQRKNNIILVDMCSLVLVRMKIKILCHRKKYSLPVFSCCSLIISLMFSERIRRRNRPRRTSNDSNKQQQRRRPPPCPMNPLRVSFPLLLNLISNPNILHDMSDSFICMFVSERNCKFLRE